MVGGDESSRLRMANKPAVLADYQPLLTALWEVSKQLAYLLKKAKIKPNKLMTWYCFVTA